MTDTCTPPTAQCALRGDQVSETWSGVPVLLMSKDADGDAARAIAIAINGEAVKGAARIRQLEAVLAELTEELAELKGRFT